MDRFRAWLRVPTPPPTRLFVLKMAGFYFAMGAIFWAALGIAR